MKKQPSAKFSPADSNGEQSRFGPVDSEGFRTFSLYDEDHAEVVRFSVHIDRISSSLPRFTDSENKGLMLAATMAAARDGAKTDDPAILSAWIQHVMPTVIAIHIEKGFPRLAKMSFEVAVSACTKFAISYLVETHGAPRVYDKNAGIGLMAQLYRTVTEGFMRIVPGRRPKLLQQLRDTKDALERLDNENSSPGYNWTPQRVARDGFKPTDPEHPGIDPSTISGWLRDNKTTWKEWSKAARSLGN